MKRNLQISIILLWVVNTAFAQEVIKGIVKDESGASLPGATVVIKGTNSFALSDVTGSFSLQPVKELPVTLLISSVGFKTQDVEVYELNEEPLEVLLKNDNVLDEIVVVGYGEQKKSDLVGAVSRVDPSQIKTIPESSFETQLQGGVAGV